MKTSSPPPGLHPVKQLVSLNEMVALVAGGKHHCTIKKDGELSVIEFGGAEILAERMRGEISGHFYTAKDREMFQRHGEWFAALTVSTIHGENVLNQPARWRRDWLKSALILPPNVILAEVVTDCAATMASGAEGIVATPWDAPWGNLVCHKAEAIYECTVIQIGATQSAMVRVHASGGNCRVKLGGGAIDQVRVGSVLRIAGMGLTDDGKIRQPVKCRKFLVKY